MKSPKYYVFLIALLVTSLQCNQKASFKDELIKDLNNGFLKEWNDTTLTLAASSSKNQSSNFLFYYEELDFNKKRKTALEDLLSDNSFLINQQLLVEESFSLERGYSCTISSEDLNTCRNYTFYSSDEYTTENTIPMYSPSYWKYFTDTMKVSDNKFFLDNVSIGKFNGGFTIISLFEYKCHEVNIAGQVISFN